jgi:hypothetical protein
VIKYWTLNFDTTRKFQYYISNSNELKINTNIVNLLRKKITLNRFIFTKTINKKQPHFRETVSYFNVENNYSITSNFNIL